MNNSILCLTRDDPEYSHDRQVKDFIEGGGRFIQFRSKTLPPDLLLKQATQATNHAKACDAKLVINDHIELAREIDAHGVHLGASDDTVTKARSILSKGKIVGRTVHSIEEAVSVKRESPDYVGLGPYRTSTTKKDLQPVLSDDQFQSIVEILAPIPVYLIGGLSTDDFPLIQSFGLRGIALCSALFSVSNLMEQTKLAVEKSRAFPELSSC